MIVRSRFSRFRIPAAFRQNRSVTETQRVQTDRQTDTGQIDARDGGFIITSPVLCCSYGTGTNFDCLSFLKCDIAGHAIFVTLSSCEQRPIRNYIFHRRTAITAIANAVSIYWSTISPTAYGTSAFPIYFSWRK